jgi:ferredoxin
VLAADKLGELAAALSAAGYRVIAPVADKDGQVVRLAAWSPPAVIRTDVVPVNSVKDVLFPPSEVIGRYDLQGGDFTVRDVVAEAPKTAVLCARPCDAAALTLLDTIFNWDFPDAFYNAHRAATTVVSLACAAPDENCFCTSVGGRPDNTSGADAILRPAGGGAKLILEPLTDKGAALAAACGPLLAEATVAADPPPDVHKRFDQATITAWLEGNFESPLWRRWAMACLGCGACAYACPTCHCFDIQDEAHAQRMRAPAELGHVRAVAVHPARRRAQPAARPDRPATTANHAQVQLHPRAIRPDRLRGVRAMRPRLPGRPGHRGDLPSHREGR